MWENRKKSSLCVGDRPYYGMFVLGYAWLLFTAAATVAVDQERGSSFHGEVEPGSGFNHEARAIADLDGDGVAEVLPPHTIVADFNSDGLLEIVRYEGRLLTLSNGLQAEEHMIELSEPIQGLEARDVDHDGKLDLLITLASGGFLTMDGVSLSREVPPVGVQLPGGSLKAQACSCPPLANTWNTGNDLNLVRAAVFGEFDGDNNTDILTVNWPTPTMRVYENDANNSFVQVFSTPGADAPPGAFVTVAGGDTDLDGWGEIIGAETSSLNQVFLYEATGDNIYVKREINISESDFTGQQSPSKLMVADTDSDGKMEIIFDTSSSTGAGSKVFIYEHSGAIGENTYTKVFEYSTVSYLFNFTIGDSDNDGQQEIVMAFGGFGGFPINLRRLENVGDNTYVHKIIQPGGIGLALGPTVADIDLDGLNELVFGGVVSDQGGGVFIYEAIADDTYQLTFSEGGLAGNGLASAVGPLQCGPQPVIAVGSAATELDMWKLAGQTYVRVLGAPITSGGQNRYLQIGPLDGDSRPDLMFSSSGVDDRVYVYEEAGLPGDIDGDGDVDFDDLGALVAVLLDMPLDPAHVARADMNGDNNSDGIDIQLFVNTILVP